MGQLGPNDSGYLTQRKRAVRMKEAVIRHACPGMVSVDDANTDLTWPNTIVGN
jgi:hypothetical protein